MTTHFRVLTKLMCTQTLTGQGAPEPENQPRGLHYAGQTHYKALVVYPTQPSLSLEEVEIYGLVGGVGQGLGYQSLPLDVSVNLPVRD